ncbi:MAG: hypothetical protein GYA21_11800 [Myxococcales bacterium]|nr:hypothetical protein [Myxococcales bacterium]
MKRVFRYGCGTMLALALALPACSSGSAGCPAGQTGGLTISLRPRTGAYANGTAKVTATVTGTDANCQPLPDGAVIQMSLSDASPEGVGQFTNGEQAVDVSILSGATKADIVSNVVGTVRVNAMYSDPVTKTIVSAPPQQAVFLEPQTTGQCAISLTATPLAILGDGSSTSTITATLISDTGGAMPNGTAVTFSTDKGKFTNSNDKSYQGSTTASQATAQLQSESITADTQATVTATFKCDNATQDTKSNTIKVRFVVSLDHPILTLSAQKTEVMADGASTIGLTAELLRANGERAGADVPINFFTNLGTFSESNAVNYEAMTDANGVATATFLAPTQSGIANIRASAYIDGENASDEVQINVRQLGFVEYKGAVPAKLGVKGSGVNESSVLTFVVKDTTGATFPAGQLVEFTMSNAPGVTLEPLSERTDDKGEVRTTLKSGTLATTVTVTATARVGVQSLQATSNAIAIVGAKPNARYMTFSCELLNVGGLVIDFQEVKCTVGLADRYTNKIGFATNVTFKTEAGSITPSAATEETGDKMGLATVLLRTSNPRPADVSPLSSEPRMTVGNHVYNPRDGLLMIIAATTGEEEFTDVNGNGVYDTNEPYVDLAEPYLDEDDDGIHDANEQFIDANGNFSWDGPNGQWDSNTIIWTPTWMVWTGHMATGGDCNGEHASIICPASFNIAKGMDFQFTYCIMDQNLNPLNGTLNLSLQVEGKGSAGSSSPPLPYQSPDILGCTVNWAKVQQIQGSEACQSSDPVCYQNVLIECGPSAGLCGSFIAKGASITDTTPAAAGSVTLKAAYRESNGAGAAINDSIVVGGIFQ